MAMTLGTTPVLLLKKTAPPSKSELMSLRCQLQVSIIITRVFSATTICCIHGVICMLMDTAYLYALLVNIDIDNIVSMYIYMFIYMYIKLYYICVYISSAGTIAIVWLCAEHGLGCMLV